MKKTFLIALFLGISLSFTAQKNPSIFPLCKTFKVRTDLVSLIFDEGEKIKGLKMEKVFEKIVDYDYVRDPPFKYVIYPKYKGKIGALTITGNFEAKVTLPFEYDYYYLEKYYDQPKLIVKKGNLWGVVNDTGYVIVPVKQITRPILKGDFNIVKSGSRYSIYSNRGIKLPFTIKDTAQLKLQHDNLYIFYDEKNQRHIYNYKLMPLFSDSIVKVRANKHFIRVDLLNNTPVVVAIENGKRFYNVTEADEIPNMNAYPRHFMNERLDEELAMMESGPESEYKVLQNSSGKKALLDTAWSLITKFEYDSIARLYYHADSVKYLHLIAMMRNKKFAIYELPKLNQITRHQYDDIKLN